MTAVPLEASVLPPEARRILADFRATARSTRAWPPDIESSILRLRVAGAAPWVGPVLVACLQSLGAAPARTAPYSNRNPFVLCERLVPDLMGQIGPLHRRAVWDCLVALAWRRDSWYTKVAGRARTLLFELLHLPNLGFAPDPAVHQDIALLLLLDTFGDFASLLARHEPLAADMRAHATPLARCSAWLQAVGEVDTAALLAACGTAPASSGCGSEEDPIAVPLRILQLRLRPTKAVLPALGDLPDLR